MYDGFEQVLAATQQELQDTGYVIGYDPDLRMWILQVMTEFRTAEEAITFARKHTIKAG